MINPTIAVKKAWALLPTDVQLILRGLGSAAIGGASVAGGLYFSDRDHYTFQAVKESWPIIVAGASSGVALYLRNSPLPKWKWDRAVEKGVAVERRAAPPPVLPPEVIVLPENPPGDPLNKKE